MLQAKKGPESGKKGPKVHFEASSSFVYCLWFYFEFKNREEYHKIQSDTIFIDVYSIWGGLCIKKGTKRVKKSQIWVSRLLEALFVVTEKYSQAKTDGAPQINHISMKMLSDRSFWYYSLVLNPKQNLNQQKKASRSLETQIWLFLPLFLPFFAFEAA